MPNHKIDRSIAIKVQTCHRPAQVDVFPVATVITDLSGSPFTLQFLIDKMKVNPRNIYHRFDPNSHIDVEIKVGNDWLS